MSRYPKGYKRAGYDTGPETMVQQQFRDEVDVNTIVRRFGMTREMPSGLDGGVYGDFTGISDYESAVAAVERAQSGFLTLDPEVRARYENDPGLYLAAVAQMSDEELEVASGRREPAPRNAPSEGSGSPRPESGAKVVAPDLPAPVERAEVPAVSSGRRRRDP